MRSARSSRRAIRMGIAALFVFLAGCASINPAGPVTPLPASLPEGITAVDPPGAPNDFTLTSQANKPVHLSDYRGKLVLMTFGYTHCPDECPINLANFTQVKHALGSDADQVVFMFISVDGTRDTPDVLAKYIASFDPAFVGLTGDETSIQSVAKIYGGELMKDQGTDAVNYTVTHTASWFLVDRQGRWRRVYSYQTDPKIVAADIRQALKG